MTPHTAPSSAPLWEFVLGLLLAIAGFSLSCWLFFPGMATHDALAVYDQAHLQSFGDWQPPLLGQIWIWLEPIFGYGPQAMFVPTNIVYWGGLWLLFLALRRTGSRAAWLALCIGFLPPTFVLIGIVWRDVIFSSLWLLAFALALLTGGERKEIRWAGTVLALVFFMIGMWLRPNALFGAVPLLAFLLWPRDWRWKRFFIFALPAMIAIQASAHVINYTWLKARHDNALHSIFVFDLLGITHFSDQNVFPVPEWTPEQLRIIKTVCYNPNYWDAIWWEGCGFPLARLNRDEPPGTKLFGSPTLRSAWMKAIVSHPVAYARHRLAYFKALMTNRTMVLFDQKEARQWRHYIIKDRPYLIFESSVIWLHAHTPLFRGLTWLVLSLAIGVAALRRDNGRGKAAVLALSLSGSLYALSYLVFGVAAEYRYVYWTALSSLGATAILIVTWAAKKRIGTSPARLASSNGRRTDVL